MERVIKGVHLRIGGFPKIKATLLGVRPHRKDYSILGSILGSFYSGHMGMFRKNLETMQLHL